MPDLIKPKIFDKTTPGDNHKLSPGMKNLYNEAYGHLIKKSTEPKTEINNRLKSQEVSGNIKAKEISQPQTKMVDKPNANVNDFGKYFSGEKITKLLGFRYPIVKRVAQEMDKIAVDLSKTGKSMHQNGDTLEQAGKVAIDSGKPISGSSLYETGQELKAIGQPLEQNLGFFPHRGLEDKYIDYKAAFEAYKIASLDKYPGVTENLIPAIMRNEQHFYKAYDDIQNNEIKMFGKIFPADNSASIGSAQIQIGRINELIGAKDNNGNPVYPYLQHFKANSLGAALEPQNAALLTAANLDYNAKKLIEQHVPVNDRTLAYMWNPDVQQHDDGSYGSLHGLELRVEKNFATKKLRNQSQEYPYNEDLLNASKHVHNVLNNYPGVEQQKKNLKL